MRKHNLGLLLWIGIDRCAINGIAARRISSIGPVHHTTLEIEFQIDRLRQTVVPHLDIGAVGRGLTLRDFDIRAADAAQARIVRTFLRPVELPALRINGDSDAPSGQVTAIGVASPGFDKGFNFRTVEIRPHDSHPFPVRPIQFAVFLIEMKLLWRVRGALWNDDPAILPVEIGPLNGTVVEVGNPHVGPVNVTRINVHCDAIGESAVRYYDLSAGAVRIHRHDTVAA